MTNAAHRVSAAWWQSVRSGSVESDLCVWIWRLLSDWMAAIVGFVLLSAPTLTFSWGRTVGRTIQPSFVTRPYQKNVPDEQLNDQPRCRRGTYPSIARLNIYINQRFISMQLLRTLSQPSSSSSSSSSSSYCIVLYSSIHIAPLNSHRQTEALLVRLAPWKETSLKSDKDVERLDDRREARAEGGRRFQIEGPIRAKDLDMAMVVLVRGTKAPACPWSVEDEGMWFLK